MVPKDFAKCFAEVMRRRRKQSKMSQEKLSERADLSSKMISLVERGERTPSITVADSIARGLSIPLWRLVKDAEDLRRERV
jgi:transcriptional regulator with XRE-family HTH domain